MKNKKLVHSFLLLMAAMIWGGGFVAQSEGGDIVGPYTFNCVRSIIGGIVLLPLIIFMDKKGLSKSSGDVKADRKNLIIAGIVCGIALFVAGNVQQLGISMGTPSGKAGFLTACYIVIVPILSIFIKKKCPWNVWVSVLVALVGLYKLCINGEFTLKPADGLLLLCAFMFSIHIIVIDKFSPFVDGVKLSCVQFFTAGILTLIPVFFTEMTPWEGNMKNWLSQIGSLSAWGPILYAGAISSGVGYTLQIVGQDGVNSTVASILLSAESVFSVLAGWLIQGQTLSVNEGIGCLLIFFAIIFAQIPMKPLFKRQN